jgi:cell division protein FtsZ
MSLSGAKGMLIHFHIHPQVSLFAINDVMMKINQTIDSNAEIIFGTTTDESLSNDEVKITIVATGFETSNDEQPKIVQTKNEEIQIPKKTVKIDNYDVPPLMRNYQLKYQLN